MSEARRGRVDRARVIVKNLTWALAVLCALMLGSVVVLQGYQMQKLSSVAVDARRSAEEAKRNTDRLVDCTTPGGKCYEQGRSTTSGAVGSINKVTVAAIYCSGKLGPTATVVQLNSCVMALVK